MMDRLSQQQKVNDRITSPLVFLSYAEEDKAYCESFIRHMREPIRQKMFMLWQPYNIEAGLDREHEITSHLQWASLILLMISADYLADDICYQQMQQAISLWSTTDLDDILQDIVTEIIQFVINRLVKITSQYSNSRFSIQTRMLYLLLSHHLCILN